jgi:hypothetical protein
MVRRGAQQPLNRVAPKGSRGVAELATRVGAHRVEDISNLGFRGRRPASER